MKRNFKLAALTAAVTAGAGSAMAYTRAKLGPLAKPAAVGLVAMGAATAALAAPPDQPDVADVVAFILGSALTIGLIGNARLIIAATVGVYRWVRGAIR